MNTDDVAEKIGEYWDGRAAGFDAEHNTEDTEAWKRVLLRLLGANSNTCVLDLGTGTGFLANLAASLGFRSIGVDISEEMLKLAVVNARRSNVAVPYMYGNVVQLPFVDETVDCIVNARLLWTLIQPEAALREWNRVLKPGGSIFCFNRFKDRLGSDVRQNFYGNASVDGELGVMGASGDDLVAMTRRNGFVDVVFENLDSILPTVPGYEPWHLLRGTKPPAV